MCFFLEYFEELEYDNVGEAEETGLTSEGKRRKLFMALKNDISRFVAVAAAALVVSVVFVSRPCVAKAKIHTYKEGFTYQNLDEEVIRRIRGKSYKKGAKISFGELRYLKMRYVDFDGNVQDGEWIVSRRQTIRNRWRTTIHQHLITGRWRIPINFPITVWVWRLISIRESIRILPRMESHRQTVRYTG